MNLGTPFPLMDFKPAKPTAGKSVQLTGMERFTLEDLARLSDADALRRRNDARNVAVVRWYLRGFLLVSFIQWVAATHAGETAAAMTAGINFIFILVLIPLFRRIQSGRSGRLRFLDRLAARLARTSRGGVLSYLAIQFLLVLVYSRSADDVHPWLMVFPYLALPLRLAASELLLLEGWFLVGSFTDQLVRMFIGNPFQPGITIAVGVQVAIAVIVGLGLTYRFRRNFLRQWHEQRESAREQIRMREELEFAREIQLGMLPVESPAVDWLDIATISLPASEVGGDYFDFFEINEGRLAVVQCDVAGHGLASGLVLSGVRSCLTLLSDELDRPARVMKRMHRMVRTTSRHRMLVTLSILLFDRQTLSLMIASAGHPPAMIRRHRTGEVDEISTGDLPLGAGLASEFGESSTVIESGDVVVLHTDGIYEALDDAEEQYGLERLRQSIAAWDGVGSARDLRDLVIRDLWSFKGGARQQDDITLVVVRVV